MSSGVSGSAGVPGLEALAAAFVDRTLPKAAWTHETHLKVGLWHVARWGEAEALAKLRKGIRALNEAHGVENTTTGGYHETITRFYVWRLARFLEGEGAGLGLDEASVLLLERHGGRDLPLRHWSRERLFSPEARAAWVEPDLAPLEA